jgi:hypothetical protein
MKFNLFATDGSSSRAMTMSLTNPMRGLDPYLSHVFVTKYAHEIVDYCNIKKLCIRESYIRHTD